MTTYGFKTEDAFDAGTSSYGSSPVMWQRFEPWTTAETATGFGIECRPGDIHNGYKGTFNLDTGGAQVPYGLPDKPAAVSYGDPTTLGVADDLFCAFLSRQGDRADGRAYLDFSLQTLSGTTGDDAFRYIGVCGRCTGQTVTSSGTSDERLTDGDGYWFMLGHEDGVATQYMLLRVNAGVVTVLDTQAVTLSALGLQYPRRLSLRIEASGSDVLLTAKTRATFGQVGSQALETIFTYTDSSASKLTSAGRWGWGSTQGRSNADGDTVPLVDLWALRDFSDGSLVSGDRFIRLNDALLLDALEDPLGNDGKSLLSGWYGDLRASGNVLNGELESHTGGTIKTEGAGGIYLSTVPGFEPDVDRSVAITFEGGGTGAIQFGGLALRVSANPDATFTWGDAFGLRAYVAYIQYTQSTTTWAAYLYAYSLGDETLLATYTPTSLVVGTPFTLRAVIQNVGGASSAEGMPEINIQLNGTTIPWVGAQVPGVTVNSSTNYVYDTRSDAILQGANQGIVGRYQGTSSRVVFDNWSLGPGADDSGGNDEGSIVINGETAGTTGVLLDPDFEYGYSVERLASTRVFRYESGYVYRSLAQSEERRRWTLRAVINETEMGTLEDFWIAHNGAEIPFRWAEPDDREVVDVCFDQAALNKVEVAPGAYTVTINLLELFPQT